MTQAAQTPEQYRDAGRELVDNRKNDGWTYTYDHPRTGRVSAPSLRFTNEPDFMEHTPAHVIGELLKPFYDASVVTLPAWNAQVAAVARAVVIEIETREFEHKVSVANDFVTGMEP